MSVNTPPSFRPSPPSSSSGGHRIVVEGLSSGYHGKKVLEDVSFTIDEPAIYVVLGPNGAGKTTLFRTWPACSNRTPVASKSMGRTRAKA